MTANNSSRANGRRRRGGQASTPDTATVLAAKAALQAALLSNGTAEAPVADPTPEPAPPSDPPPLSVPPSAHAQTHQTEEKSMSGEVIEVTPKPAKGRATKKAEIQLHQPMGSIFNRPVMPSDIEVVSTMTVAGDRPVVASHLELFGSFLNGRPIESSSVKVFEMLGDRPVFESGFQIVDDGGLPGGRPIMASRPELLEASVLPGGRPIASNDIDDPVTLMGFLD
jgi:hypothetical protein